MPKRSLQDYKILRPTPLWKVATLKRTPSKVHRFGRHPMWQKWTYEPELNTCDEFVPKLRLDDLKTCVTEAAIKPPDCKKRRSENGKPTTHPIVIKRKNKKTNETITITKKPILGVFWAGITPSKIQRNALDTQLRVATHAYNICVWLTNKRNIFEGVKKESERKTILQKYVVTNNIDRVPSEFRMPNNLKTEKDVAVTPGRDNDDWYFAPLVNSTCVKLYAMHNFYESWKSSMSRLKGDEGKFTMHFKSECAPNSPPPQTGVIGVQAMYIKPTEDPRFVYIMPTVLNCSAKSVDKKPIRVNKARHPPITRDVKIIKRPNGKYCILIPIDDLKWTRGGSPDGHKTPNERSVCGIDPGIRTFLTGIDVTTSETFEYGTTKDRERLLEPLEQRIDEVHARISKSRERGKMTEATNRIRQLNKLEFKKRVLIKHLHVRAACDLIKENSLVVLGDIQVRDIVRKEKRRLSANTVRRMMCWKTCAFKNHLLNRANGSQCVVLLQEEAYTSKTCCACAHVHGRLGGNKRFICPQCGIDIDRDVNGAVNILQKGLNTLFNSPNNNLYYLWSTSHATPVMEYPGNPRNYFMIWAVAKWLIYR